MSKGLKALKEIDIWTNVSNTKMFKEHYKSIEKELKALEIILNYVPLNIIRSYLEKEEIGLLKEVLGNE